MKRSTASLSLVVCLFAALALTAVAQRQQVGYQVAAPADLVRIAKLSAAQQLRLAITLPLHNQQDLNELLRDLYDPASPVYRRFLTVQQFTDRFGPTPAEYAQVIAFAESHGLRVTRTFSDRMVVDVTGSVAGIEQAFRVNLNVYQHPTEARTFYAPDVEPTVEPGLPILAVNGLSSLSLPQPMLKRASPYERLHSYTTGSGSGGQFLGSDMRAAYGGGTALDGAGQVVGLIELGPYRLADVQSYFSTLGQPLTVPIVNVLLSVDGVCGAGCDDGEEAIDIQQAIAMAPNLSALIVYEAYGSSSDALNAYTQAANDDIAKQLSISFGWGGTPGSEPGYEQVFQQLAAQGQSSFVASGDSGGNSGGGGYPGNSPNITDAGGTDLTTTSAGGPWSSETGWNGSGGGWNTASPIPAYQSPAINSTNGGDSNYRNIPDVSAEANTDNYFCANGSCQGGIGGTSLAAPRWAAFVALINQQAATNANAGGGNPTLGLLNSSIYPIGLSQNANAPYSSVFHDVILGSNPSDSNPPLTCTIGSLGCLDESGQGLQGFNATTGFDLVTGWGSPNGPAIFSTLFPATTNANFSMAASPSVLNLTPGGGSTSSISISDMHGFNAATSLSVVIPGAPNSAPAGLTATLSSNSIPAGGGPVTLTVSTTSATPGGTYVIAVVGTSGNLTQATYVTVALPAFVGLTANPIAGVMLRQGSTATSTIGIDEINGFNGTVSLVASGLPTGVSASFTSVNSTTSTMTLSAAATAALTGSGKPISITVIGSATGSTAQSVAVNVFIVPPLSGGAGTQVDLSSAANIYAFFDDANESSITASNSLDGVGFAFSANLLGTGMDFKGTQFTFGSPNQADAVYGTGSAITLPAGTYASLQLLATGINGNQTGQTITVTYSDGSTSQFTQSFSDWCSGLNGNGCVSTGSNSGESVALPMPYRDSAGGPDDRIFYLYAYSFSLNTSKTVQSITLPNNRNVVVLAMTLMPVPAGYSLSATTANPGSVAAGSSSTAAVTITPANGYSGSVTLSCSISPVVAGSAAPTCSVSPNPVPVAAGSARATVTFSSVAPTPAIVRSSSRKTVRPQPEHRDGVPPLYALLTLLPVTGMAGLGMSAKSRRKCPRSVLTLWLALVCGGILLSCGGGNSMGVSPPSCSSAASVPTGLTAASTTSSATNLTWNASTAPQSCTLTGYVVYQNGSQIASTTSTNYSVTGLSGGTQYSFTVASKDSFGTSAQSAAATANTGTTPQIYTLTITGKDSNNVVQTGTGAIVSVTVN